MAEYIGTDSRRHSGVIDQAGDALTEAVHAVVTDPSNAWTAEGAEIPVTDPDLDELIVTPPRLAGLTVVSNELMARQRPVGAGLVGQGLVRDLQVKLDAAYFGDTVANGPSGLESLADTQTTTLAFSTEQNLDPFAEAISLAENAGVQAIALDGNPSMAFVGNPTDVLAVSTTKTNTTDSTEPLLGRDATEATGRSVLGVPLYSSPAVGIGAMWLVPRDKAFVVMRTNPEVIADARLTSVRTELRSAAYSVSGSASRTNRPSSKSSSTGAASGVQGDRETENPTETLDRAQ